MSRESFELINLSGSFTNFSNFEDYLRQNRLVAGILINGIVA